VQQELSSEVVATIYVPPDLLDEAACLRPPLLSPQAIRVKPLPTYRTVPELPPILISIPEAGSASRWELASNAVWEGHGSIVSRLVDRRNHAAVQLVVRQAHTNGIEMQLQCRHQRNQKI
jgi:hypothetical protein